MLFFLFVHLKDVKTPSQVKMCMDPDTRHLQTDAWFWFHSAWGEGATMVETFHLPKCPNNRPNVSDWPSWSKTNQSDQIKGSYRSCGFFLLMCPLTSAALMAKRPLNAR